jgi:ABC-type multidrug transport system permease subunit
MPEQFHPQLELIRARLREFFREPGIVFWVFGFPLLMALALGFAFRSKPPERPAVAVVSANENELTRKLLQSPQVRAERLSAKDAERALTRAKVDVLVKIEETGVTFRSDPTQEKSAYARLLVDDILERCAGRSDTLQKSDSRVSETGSRYIDFLLPGLIGLNLMGSSMWGVGYNLVVARKRKLLRRYAVTPMRRTHFLLSYFYSRALFLTLELSAIVTFGSLLFQTVVQGSYLALVATCFLGAGSFAGMSLLIGARVDNTETANGWMNLVQLPMWMLSGPFFSYERFPVWLQKIIEFLPLTALVNALRAIWNDGASLAQLGFELSVLLVWGCAGFAVALKSFRWQ